MEELSETVKGSNIDQLTLELFMNKKNYKKYIEKTDPRKHAEIQSHHLDLQRYRGSIISMTDDLLENPNLQITTEIGDIFEAYTKAIIRHLKNKALDEQIEKEEHMAKSVDSDVMFGEIDEHMDSQETMDSYWGAERVVKKPSSIKKSFFNKDISKFAIPRINGI